MSKRNPMVAMTLGAGLLVLASVLGAYAQLQSSDQQKCLNAVNKDGAALAKTQGKRHVACVKGAGQGALAEPAQDCITSINDPTGKVAKAYAKTTADAAKLCGTPPSFGFTDALTVNFAAHQAGIQLTSDVYGGDLDAAIITCATSKAGCACQQKISKDVEALSATKFATFVSCKKAALKAGATSATALSNCVQNAGTAGSIAADTKGKIAKAVSKLNADIVKSCDTPGVTGAFPGTCTGLAGAPLGTCLDTQVECRVCQAINEMDGLFVNCDQFDNGVLDGTCASGTGPTPTPTPTQTTTPTPVPTFEPGTIIKGSLTKTDGSFNYNLTVGLTGANSACNSNFPGTHACTYAELQNAAAAGELDLLVDTMGITVTAFWAIDPAANPLTAQCHDDSSFPCPGGICPPGHTWEYPTAHTPSRGQRVTLNNATGVLGPLATGLQCNQVSNQSWVGCCQ